MISAIVFAAGQSKRMGQPKMLMPWGQTTVIDRVISTLSESGLNDIYVVTGGNQEELKDALKVYDLRYIHNKDFTNGEMLTSVKVGLNNLGRESEVALFVLGDQPQIESKVVQLIIGRFNLTRHKIIVPSYQMRRGHPWLLEKSYWKEILQLTPPTTLKEFLAAHKDEIDYVNVDSPSVLQDLDTQADYSRYKP